MQPNEIFQLAIVEVTYRGVSKFQNMEININSYQNENKHRYWSLQTRPTLVAINCL